MHDMYVQENVKKSNQICLDVVVEFRNDKIAIYVGVSTPCMFSIERWLKTLGTLYLQVPFVVSIGTNNGLKSRLDMRDNMQ